MTAPAQFKMGRLDAHRQRMGASIPLLTSGPATAGVLRRQRDVFGDARFARQGSFSVAHLYNSATLRTIASRDQTLVTAKSVQSDLLKAW